MKEGQEPKAKNLGDLILSKLNHSSKTIKPSPKPKTTITTQTSKPLKPPQPNPTIKKLKHHQNKSTRPIKPQTPDLAQIISQLGGDADDLALINLRDDDDEFLVTDHHQKDPKLDHELKALVAQLDFSSSSHLNKPSAPPPKIKNSKQKPQEKESEPNHHQPKEHQLTRSKKDTITPSSKALAPEPSSTADENEARRAKEAAKAVQRRLEAVRAAAATTSKPSLQPDHSHKPRETVASIHSTGTASWLIEAKPVWYDTAYLPALPTSTQSRQPLPSHILTTLQERGHHVLTTLASTYTESLRPGKARSSTSASNIGLSEADKSFIHKILTAGTSADKLSALILLVSSAPLQSISHLTALLTLCKKKSRDEAGRAVRAVVEWLRGSGKEKPGGLPERKLKYFHDQTEGLAIVHQMRNHLPRKSLEVGHTAKVEGDEWLALWSFEDWLKKWYLELLGVIESISHDPLVFNRIQSVSYLYYLLSEKAEQEQNLLRLLVNKLGDREKSVCSRTGYYLLQMLQTHPKMKAIVTREVSSLMLKPFVEKEKPKPKSKGKKKGKKPHIVLDQPGSRVHDHARYYGTITLNQIPLNKDEDGAVAKKLMEVYFEMFRDLLGKTAEEEEQEEEQALEELNEEEIEAAEVARVEEEKVVKKKKKSSSSKKNEPEPDAVAETKARLMAAILTGLNRALPYGTLDDDRLALEMESLFKIVHSAPIAVSVQALMLIQQLASTKPKIEDRFYRVLYEMVIDYRLVGAVSKQALFLNLLFKSIKIDKCQDRVDAFVRRIVQVLGLHQAPFVCSTLALLDDLLTNSRPMSRRLLGAVEQRPDDQQEPLTDEEVTQAKVSYDGRKREPRYAHASSSPLWELIPLLSHHHPAVSLNARELLEGKRVSSSVDVIEVHSLSQFLDRFVYKRPKKIVGGGETKTKGTSIMQPVLHDRIGDVMKKERWMKKEIGDNQVGDVEEVVNSRTFAEREVVDVGVDEIFFHKYFAKKFQGAKEEEEKKEKKKQKKKKNGGDDDDGFGDFGGKGGSDDGSEEEEEDDEDEIWAAMRRSMADEGLDEEEDEELEGLMDSDDQEGLIGPDDDDDEEVFEGLMEEDEDEEDGSSTMLIEEDMDDLLEFDEEEEEEEEPKLKKRNREEDEDQEENQKKSNSKNNNKKKKWGSGVFVDADEYAKMLEGEEEEENL